MSPEEQQTKGFAVQTFFIGISSCDRFFLTIYVGKLASASWGIKATAAPGVIPDTVKWSFYLGGIVFLLSVLWTTFRTKEYSPEEMAAFAGEAQNEKTTKESLNIDPAKYNKQGLMLIGGGLGLGLLTYFLNLYLGLYILTAVFIVYGILHMIVAKRYVADHIDSTGGDHL